MRDPAPAGAAFLGGGGRMGALMRAHDWAATPVGPPETWPQALKTFVRLLLASRHPMFIWWGGALTSFFNDASGVLIGPDRQSGALGRPGQEALAELWNLAGPQVEQVMAGRDPLWHERQRLPAIRGDRGEDVWWTYGLLPIEDAAAPTGVGGVLMIGRDLTTEAQAEQTHNDETGRLRNLLAQAPGFMALLRGPDHVLELTNTAYRRLVGREGTGKPIRAVLPELKGQGFFGLLDRVYATGTPYIAREAPVTFAPDPGGAPDRRIVDFVYQPVRNATGAVSGIFVAGNDVTEAYRNRNALAAGNARYAAVLDAMGEGFVMLDEAFRVIEINAEGLRIDGRPRHAILGRTHWELWPLSVGTPVEDAYRRVMAERAPVTLEHHYATDAHDLWLELRIYPVPGGVAAFYRDVTGRKRAEAALREGEHRLRDSEERFRTLTDLAPAMVWFGEPSGTLSYLNSTWYDYTGQTPEQALPLGWAAVVHPGDHDALFAVWDDARARGALYETEARLRRHDGVYRWFLMRAQPLRAGAGQEVTGWLGSTSDIDDRKRAELVLQDMNAELERRVEARTAELMAAEASLRQSQKMEAVGQLTGGIAHDFNNMLQAIGGNLELVWRRVEQGRGEDAERFMNNARETVKRAAALTHRLLAFARRQALQPRSVQPDRLVGNLVELIRGTVGPGIAVELQLSDGAWPVLCDPNQLENALLNLAINARDAMPGGGRLTVTTRHARLSRADMAGQDGTEPGEYMEIAVADTGTGMDEATRARAFEPFFTTKPLGQGTGLGLSQLYGFVQQSNGIVRLDSAPGQGTTVRIFLARHHAAQEDGADLRGKPDEAGAGETILLLEDEDGVRATTAEHLRDLGYRVREAANGPAALHLLRSAARVDVLVTDVGLPGGMNGRQVADAARERRPHLPVLFITGYAGSILDGQLAPGMAVIGKPFALNALANRVRTMLNAAAA